MILDIEDRRPISVKALSTQRGLGTVTFRAFYLFEALYAPYILGSGHFIPILESDIEGPKKQDRMQIVGLGFEPWAVWLQIPETLHCITLQDTCQWTGPRVRILESLGCRGGVGVGLKFSM